MDYWKKQEKLDQKWSKKQPAEEPIESEVYCDKHQCIYCDGCTCLLDDYDCRINLDTEEFYGARM